MAKDLPEGAPVMLRMSVENDDGYLSWLGVQLDDIQHGEATLSVPYDRKFADEEIDPPTVHHGVVSSLLEQAGELAVRTTMDDPVNDRVDPLNLSLNFIHEAAHDLTATAEVVETRETAAVATITVESKTRDGTVTAVATGQAVFGID